MSGPPQGPMITERIEARTDGIGCRPASAP